MYIDLRRAGHYIEIVAGLRTVARSTGRHERNASQITLRQCKFHHVHACMVVKAMSCDMHCTRCTLCGLRELRCGSHKRVNAAPGIIQRNAPVEIQFGEAGHRLSCLTPPPKSFRPTVSGLGVAPKVNIAPRTAMLTLLRTNSLHYIQTNNCPFQYHCHAQRIIVSLNRQHREQVGVSTQGLTSGIYPQLLS